MKKSFRYYAMVWAILFVLFNVISFLFVGLIWRETFSASFWIGYGFIAVSFIGQLGCAYFVFSKNNLRKLFYNIPLIRVSFAGLIASFVFGGLCMLIVPLPYWVGGLLCLISLAATLIAVVRAHSAAEIVSDVDEKVAAQTSFIRSLTVDADRLVARAQNAAVKAECRKVYEAVRYSDSVSSDALAGVESQITIRFAALSDAVAADDADSVKSIAEEIVLLIGDRNKRSELFKN